MSTVRYEEMLPRDIVARRAKFPAAFLPLGGLEWHGEHLAVGNDALKAHALCVLAAERSGGIAFPPLWYGEPRDQKLMETVHDGEGRIRGKMKLPARNFAAGALGNTYADQLALYDKLLMYALHEIRSLGFRAVCILTGHYPIIEWARPVCSRFNRKFSDCRAWAGIEFHYVPKSKRDQAGGDHAAKWETSYLMVLRPECVDMTVHRGREKETLIGVGGHDPRTEASTEVGRQGVELIVAGMVRKARELLRQTAPRRAARK
jgi:creatinine amidohydrolase